MHREPVDICPECQIEGLANNLESEWQTPNTAGPQDSDSEYSNETTTAAASSYQAAR